GETVRYYVVATDRWGNASAPSATTAFSIGSPAAIGTYQEDSPQVRLDGRWTSSVHSMDAGGASVYATGKAKASIAFTGSAIRWVSRTGPRSGIAEVRVDGKLVASVDRFSPTNRYQSTVWQTSSLSSGTHVLEIVWTDRRNSSSGGDSIVLDSFIVPTVTPPSAPRDVQLRDERGGASLSWKPAFGPPNPASYAIYRTGPDRVRTLLARQAGNTSTYRDEAQPLGASFTYEIIAIDEYGNESAPTTSDTYRNRSTVPSTVHRASACPAATVRVNNADQLRAALSTASPGSVIRLADGVYRGSFSLDKSGSSSSPIWICGTRSAVIDSGGVARGTGMTVSGSNAVLAGFSVRNSLKGIMIVGTTNVTVADLSISDIGDEALHFRQGTTNSVGVGNVIQRTGRTNAFFGEGIYVGTSSHNWCAYNGCEPDRTSGITLLWNNIRDTSAEAIEVKEGVSNVVVYNNTVYATGPRVDGVEAAVQIKGDDNLVLANTVTTNRPVALRTLFTGGGFGVRNAFGSNAATLTVPDGSSMFYNAVNGNNVKCDNRVAPLSVPLGATCTR
ncbi:right-handed parallel beta-helix repeat-containing protein, partial [Xanthomonas perforans]